MAEEGNVVNFKYGARGGNAMDKYFDLARRDPSRLEKSIKAWTEAHEATTFYKTWLSAIDAPPEVFMASGPLQRLALSALDGIESMGIHRRPQILGEAMDSAVSFGDGGLIEWLVANGAPACPALAQSGGKGSMRGEVERALNVSWGGGKISSVSWCALAAQHGNMRALMALERCGIGAADRCAIFDGLSARLGGAEEARAEFEQSHPWVMAVALSIDEGRRAGAAAVADAVAAAWEPAGAEDQRAGWAAVEVLSIQRWSLRGMRALALRAAPMDEATKEKAGKSLADAAALAGGGSSDARSYARLAMKWAAACGGPSSGALAMALARTAERALGGSSAGDHRLSAGVDQSLAAIGAMARLLGGAGKWGRVDPGVAKEASMMIVAAAAGRECPRGSEVGRAAMDDALDSLGALAGADHALKRAGPKRM